MSDNVKTLPGVRHPGERYVNHGLAEALRTLLRRVEGGDVVEASIAFSLANGDTGHVLASASRDPTRMQGEISYMLHEHASRNRRSTVQTETFNSPTGDEEPKP